MCGDARSADVFHVVGCLFIHVTMLDALLPPIRCPTLQRCSSRYKLLDSVRTFCVADFNVLSLVDLLWYSLTNCLTLLFLLLRIAFCFINQAIACSISNHICKALYPRTMSSLNSALPYFIAPPMYFPFTLTVHSEPEPCPSLSS